MDPRFHGPGPGFNPGQPRRTPAIQSLVALRHQVTIAGSQRPPGAPGVPLCAPPSWLGGARTYRYSQRPMRVCLESDWAKTYNLVHQKISGPCYDPNL